MTEKGTVVEGSGEGRLALRRDWFFCEASPRWNWTGMRFMRMSTCEGEFAHLGGVSQPPPVKERRKEGGLGRQFQNVALKKTQPD